MSITLEEADRALTAAIAKANEQGTKMNIAVVDAGGRLVAFKRMNGAIWAGVYGSQGKAVTSAAFGRDSGVMQERAGAPIIQGIMMAEGGHMIPSQGAVPILRNGVVIGAIGCGGGTGQEDEDCARAGAAAV
ncbi:MAG: heme-binding protein [Candidatus Tectomicrobia bacterium]|nr:heme-binding protein [Candidatus Tectomicrobia bacterium]